MQPGAFRRKQEPARACKSSKEPTEAHRSLQKLKGAQGMQAGPCSSLHQLPAASRSLQEHAGAHRILQDPTVAKRSPQKLPGAQLTPGYA